MENSLENKGKKWSIEDDEFLLQSDKDIEKQAIIFRRTPWAIKCRLMHLAIQMMEDKSLDEVSDFVKISSDAILKFKERRKEKHNKFLDDKDLQNEIKFLREQNYLLQTQFNRLAQSFADICQNIDSHIF
jgi:hypothetical protein